MRDTISQIIRGIHKVLSADCIVMINLAWVKAIVLPTVCFDRLQSNSLCPIATYSIETTRLRGKNGETNGEKIQLKFFLCESKALIINSAPLF